MRRKLPFGVAQVGKSFRNEVTPGNFILRTREFEQMEMEYFVKPDAEHSKLVDYWVEQYLEWFTSIGINRDNLFLYEVPEEKRAHYSKRTVDIMYRYFPEREKPWEELMGIAWRTDFDLSVHSKNRLDAEGNRINPDSTEDLSYFDEATKQRFYPHVIEPAAGVNRTVLAVLMDAYSEKTNDKGETRVILKLARSLRRSKPRSCHWRKTSRRLLAWRRRLSDRCNQCCARFTMIRVASESFTLGKTRLVLRFASLSITSRLKMKQ